MARASAPTNLVTCYVDDRAVEVEPGTLVWDACEKAGVFVPVYCAHKKMEPVAVCRMCLVEIAGIPKLQPACATQVVEGMVIRTDTPKVSEFRNGNLEFLLLNHPLDCPVCDRGGECDLQDFAQRYGPGRSRASIIEKVHFNKAVPLSDKITLDQERCILCWRCVRYYEEITGEREIVLQKRGVQTLVDTFEHRPLRSSFQGNLPEICPVGALTHTKYRFRARPWDLRRSASVCPQCSYGCNIFVDTREDQVARFASNDNPSVDDSWLCDEGRYSFADLNRPDRVLSAEAKVGGVRQVVSYRDAIARAGGVLLRARDEYGPESIAFLGNPQMTNEEAFLTQWLARDVLATPHVDFQTEALDDVGPDDFALAIEDIEECDAVVVLGELAEESAPVLTLRLFKAETKRSALVLRIGIDPDLKQLQAQLGARGRIGVVTHQSSRHKALRLAGLLNEEGRYARVLTIVEGMNGRGCHDMGLVPWHLPGYRPVLKPGLGSWEILRACVSGQIKALVTIGHHPLEADRGFQEALDAVETVVAIAPWHSPATRAADFLLPGRTIVEKAGTVTNTEGRVQRVRVAAQSLFTFPSDLRIIGELAQAVGGELGCQPLAAPVYQRIAEQVPAYQGVQAGLRARWGGRA